MDLTNKTVVVTGGGSGIGEAMCRRFASEGTGSITVVDLNGEQAERVAAEIGGRAAQCDVGIDSEMTAVLNRTEQQEGPIDLLVMNAGIAAGGDVFVPNQDWEQAWQVNLMSHVYAVRAVLPSMLARGQGYLLHTSSAAGLLTNIGAAPYSVTKHAVVSLAEWLSMTYGDQGIKVSVLCPQFVRTPMLGDFESVGEEMLKNWIGKVTITPEEVAEVVVAGIKTESFLILPHPEVLEYIRNKTADYDRWLEGMRKLHAHVMGDVEE